MKFKVTFKDPDTTRDAIVEAVKSELKSIETLDDEERESLVDSRADKIADFASAWVTYGEYITIEFDTDAKTATVVQKNSL